MSDDTCACIHRSGRRVPAKRVDSVPDPVALEVATGVGHLPKAVDSVTTAPDTAVAEHTRRGRRPHRRSLVASKACDSVACRGRRSAPLTGSLNSIPVRVATETGDARTVAASTNTLDPGCSTTRAKTVHTRESARTRSPHAVTAARACLTNDTGPLIVPVPCGASSATRSEDSYARPEPKRMDAVRVTTGRLEVHSIA